MNKPNKICIVSTRHISYNPRVLKEADAFFAQGYDVTVVTINNDEFQYQFDEAIMSSRQWKLKTLNFRRTKTGERWRWIYLTLVQKIYAALARLTPTQGFAQRALLKGFDGLLAMAKQEGADVYLAHHAEALGVGFLAAKNNKARFGFDAEDFHTGMNEAGHESAEDKLIGFVENKYLPHCTYLTAASKGIMEAYVKKYKIKSGATILNVFPAEDASPSVVHHPPRFYWYSQTIGPNRSLEILMQAASVLTLPFELHLRGKFNNPGYQTKLLKLIHDLGLDSKVFFHEPIVAELIIADAMKYDIGLALETDVSVNRNICVTNKIFSYLMSGLAIIGTDTLGQKNIFKSFEQGVVVCKQNDASGLAAAMMFLLQNPSQISTAKNAARQAALSQFNWETESKKLIAYFEACFCTASKQSPTISA